MSSSGTEPACTLSDTEIPASAADTFREDADAGLHSIPRTLPAKYLYDARGSELYEQITELEEYYPFATEQQILRAAASEIVESACPEAVVELGSGSSEKTRILLDALAHRERLKGYGALEISEAALEGALDQLKGEYDGVRFEGVVGDFNRSVELPFDGLRRLVLFLGSTIGNLEDGDAIRLLRRVRQAQDRGDRLLVGFDLVKDVSVIEAAYNDQKGVTAAFNLNLLTRMNRELGTEFDVSAFSHRAFFNKEASRIEMHIVAESDQIVKLGSAGHPIAMSAGDSIRSEISRKFTRQQIEGITTSAGLRIERWFTDPKNYFAVVLLAPAKLPVRRPAPFTGWSASASSSTEDR